MSSAKKVKLKVCGMVHEANILAVGELNPDFMGFIFYPNSVRFVGKEFRIPDGLRPEILRVGVFVNQSVDEIVKLSRLHSLQFAQLHGNETPDVCEELKSKGVGVIKAFGVDDLFDFRQLEEYEPVVDYFLFDTQIQSDLAAPGEASTGLF